ncbi:hypothetical protein [Marinobacter qingdaonensis]|uniref:Uncharacterized protein n=1 Tax=Marinobacter qingdaonensis TaxID=3108486 RepID=A0ABU5P393_9GAMM|nr:hypothetical protein [Marinobacter sp. ASW11-75]MEA1082452.1 hypothetical protein [Marinobacter sp. ASW11-75]MEE2763233.1 hypothetical protein [Pseudomonadota bacterium]MEE3118941.1 hypothetical protein [Pseudomonadota bacterium]
MFWTFVATVFCGLGAAGIALGIRALTRKRAPKWLIPVFAGLGMLGYLIHGEYTWYDLKKSQLPEEAVIVDSESDGIYWRPWTFAFPYVTAFSTVDTKSISRDTANDSIVRFTLYRFEQKVTDAVSHRVHLLNCQSRELVPLGSDGTPRVDNMKVLDTTDTLLNTVCTG